MPNIDLVILFDLPSTLSEFLQLAGRAAQEPGKTGKIWILYPKKLKAASINDPALRELYQRVVLPESPECFRAVCDELFSDQDCESKTVSQLITQLLCSP
jgi:superfamily II DNA/RNA helicase